MNAVGQRLLLARRLVEAEVPFVVVRTFDWDDHEKLLLSMSKRAPAFDQAISALVDDLYERGLQKNVLVIAMGEFGRSPRVNAKGGRDHWPGVMSVLFSGGNYRMGQVIRRLGCQRGDARLCTLSTGKRAGDGLSSSGNRSRHDVQRSDGPAALFARTSRAGH